MNDEKPQFCTPDIGTIWLFSGWSGFLLFFSIMALATSYPGQENYKRPKQKLP